MRVLAVRDSEQVLPVDESSEIGACGLGINLEVRGHELRGDDRVLLRVAEDLQRLISLVPFLLPCLDDLFGGFDREAVQFPFAVVGKESADPAMPCVPETASTKSPDSDLLVWWTTRRHAPGMESTIAFSCDPTL